MQDLRVITRRTDRSISIHEDSDLVFVHDKDRDSMFAIVYRSRRGYLVPYTVMMREDNTRDVYERPYVFGECPAPWRQVEEVLRQLHASVSVRTMATYSKLYEFYGERILERVRRNCPQHESVVNELVPWDALHDPGREVVLGPWHGDATRHNAVSAPGGRVVLIDHAPAWIGPQEYDYGKLHASRLFEPDPEPVDAVPREYLPTVIAVIAGLIGSHGAKHPGLVDLLDDVCKRWRAEL